MKLNIQILILFLLFFTTPTFAYSEKDIITDIFSDGELIKTTSGLYRSLDPITSSIWLPFSDVIIYDDERMYNIDDDESIDVIQLR